MFSPCSLRHRNVRDFVVKDQAVPVRVGLRFAITPREMIGLTETEINYLRAGRKVSKLWLYPANNQRASMRFFYA